MKTTPILLDDLRRVRRPIIQAALKVSPSTVTNWYPEFKTIDADNGDGTFDLIKIIHWWKDNKNGSKKSVKENEEKYKLEIEKLQKDIDYKDAQTTRILDKYVERSIADQEKISLLRIIREFLERIPEYRKREFHMVHADIAALRLRSVFKEAMDQIADNSEDIKENE